MLKTKTTQKKATNITHTKKFKHNILYFVLFLERKSKKPKNEKNPWKKM